MRYFDVKLWATVEETISVAARDEDEAAEIALQIVKGGHVACSTLYWEVDDVQIGSALDVAE
jgi:hypothetical protein